MRFLLALAFSLLAIPALADTESDERDCANRKLDAEKRIEACDRLLAAPSISDAVQVRLLRNRADAKEQLEDWDGAVADYQTALGIDPQNPGLYRDLGWARLQMKDYQAVVTVLDKAIELDPRSAWSFQHRGIAWARLKNYDTALADYNRSLELDPLRPSALRARGYLYVKLGEHEAALPDFDQVLALEPYNAALYSARAAAHEELGHRQKALHDAEVARWLNPNLGLPDRIIERLSTPSGMPDPGSTDFDAPDEGRTTVYLELVISPQAKLSPMEEAIEDLINFFRPVVKPLPERRSFVSRTAGATEADITTVSTVQTHATNAEAQAVDYFRAIFPTVIPGGQGPDLHIARQLEALAGLWPLKAGASAAGSGDIFVVCPESGPMVMMLQCAPDEQVPMGNVDWKTTVEGWEDVVVPAGTFGAYRIRHSEQTTINMFGRPIQRQDEFTLWYSPQHKWWLKREVAAQDKVSLSLATEIE